MNKEFSHGKGQTELDGALRRTLRQGLDSAGKDCPDAELLAACFEHSLSTAEAAHWEKHFAVCARCQQQLAALARSEPITEQPSARWAWLALPRPSIRWLAPAVAALGAVALWIAIRPTPSSIEAPTKEQARVVTAAPQRQPESAKNAPRRVGEAPAKQPVVLAEAKPGRKAPTEGVPAAPRYFGAVALRTQPEKAAPAPRRLAAAEENPQQARDVVTKQEADRVHAPQARPAAPPAAGPVLGGVQAVVAEPRVQVEQAQVETEKRRAQSYVLQAAARSSRLMPVSIAAPGSAVLWRVGSGGRIEQSRDAGKTWQIQDSGVRADLVSGFAPSETLCWVVGQGGVVLRTTDGRRWQRVPFPLHATLIHVRASDALHAVVTSEDGQTYSTEDGGQTWRKR